MIVNEVGGKALNAICPYFTMFPIDFPYAILEQYASPGEWVLDPFCGRGTTNYASRLLGLPSIGIDSSPVAVALSQAKIANTRPEDIIEVAQQILEGNAVPQNIPEGDFWNWAFHEETLLTICRFRESLLRDSKTDECKALRALLMGALHGPLTKSKPSYLSNQSPRTYAPKPRYATKFWQSRNLHPPKVDIMAVIEERARRYYAKETNTAVGFIYQEDSQNSQLFQQMKTQYRIKWIITSPPYYGMRTYIPDQWLRMWFLGGSSSVDYSAQGQISHFSPAHFSNGLKQVWQNVAEVSDPDAQLVLRFGGINDRKADPLQMIEQSFQHSGWKLTSIASAGFASEGKRQAAHMNLNKEPLEEYDLWATRQGKPDHA